MREETLIDMLTVSGDNLNLAWHERRLILIAMIRTNFNFEEAKKLNCPEMTTESYERMFYRHHISLNG